MGADPVCAALNRASGTEPIQLFTVVDATGGLANTFVSLKGTFPEVPPSAEPVTIIQRNCVYVPRVVAAQVGQTLRVINQDTTVHNVHSLSLKNPFNITQPRSGEVFNYVLKEPDVMLRLKCDVHSWMLGYVGVVAHPYFAVSGDDGTFTIANVPPGRQTVTTWHERFGEQTQTIEVKAGQTTEVDLVYDPTTARPSTARLQELSVPLLASAQHLHHGD
jgi:plastocyanin